VASIADVIAANTRGVGDIDQRARRVRDAARASVQFWDGHLDLDALGVELADLVDDYDHSTRIGRAEAEATQRWEAAWGDDDLIKSTPGIGPVTGATVRAFFGDGTHLPNAKAAQSYVGLAPSNWSSGSIAQGRVWRSSTSTTTPHEHSSNPQNEAGFVPGVDPDDARYGCDGAGDGDHRSAAS
jgi:transposase